MFNRIRGEIMSNYAYVSLTYAIDLEQARDLGLDIPAKDEVEYAKDEFLELLDSWKRQEIWDNLEVELE
jgi:hypothetical protein